MLLSAKSEKAGKNKELYKRMCSSDRGEGGEQTLSCVLSHLLEMRKGAKWEKECLFILRIPSG